MAQTLSPPPNKKQEHDQGPQNAESPSSRSRPSARVVLIPIGLAALVGIGALAWNWFSQPETDALFVSGRIEGYETDIGSKLPGRVTSVAVREGDPVRPGQVVVQITDDEIRALLQGAEAQIKASRERERQAQVEVQVVANRILEAQLALQQAEGDAEGRILQAESNLAAAESQLAQIQAQLHQARAELTLATANQTRFAQLVEEGVIPQQEYDQIVTVAETAAATVESQKAAVQAFQRQVDVARGSLVQAQTSSFNPGIRQTQLQVLQQQLDQVQSQRQAAQAEVENAIANRDQIAARLNDLSVISPMQGVVLSRSVEPGAVVAVGQTLLTVIDLGDVYLRGYVPEGQIGKVRVGQSARVYLDSYPDQPLSAQVSAIDTQASFTPENIYFQEDRVRQVFGIRIAIDNPAGFAKPGMPADAEIVIEDGLDEDSGS